MPALATVLVPFFFATPAAAGPLSPDVHMKRVHMPAVVLPEVRSIQVTDFKGFDGAGVASSVRQALQDPDRTGGRGSGSLLGDLIEVGAGAAGEVVGGSAGALVKGLGGGAATAVDTIGKSGVRVDNGLKVDVFEVRTAGADARLGGAVEVTDKVESYTAKRKKRNAKGKVVTDSKGKPVYETVPCKRRIVTSTVRWSVAGADGALLHEQAYTRKAKDSRCAEDRSNLKSKSELAKATLGGTGRRIANEVAPYWQVDTVQLKRDPLLKEAVRHARQCQLDQALCAARHVAAAEPHNVRGQVAAGAYHEALGILPEAAGLYQKAAAINQDKLAVKASGALSKRRSEVESLTASYGLDYTVGAADYSWCPELPDGRPALAKRPTTLWSAVDFDTASKVASVPRGTRLFVTEERQDVVKVATLDGSEGWVTAKHVK